VKLVNLTPHAINIANEDGEIVRVIPPSGTVARVTSKAVPRPPIDGVPFVETVLGKVEGLPNPDGGTYYIVSQFIISALPTWPNLVRPDTGPSCLRDDNGQIVAVRALTR
jgi:hypothetical protein